MEKPKNTSKDNQLAKDSKNQILSGELKQMWGSDALSDNHKSDTKKLLIKLETNGTEKRKIMLKLESGSSSVSSKNYNLLSELLKEFFNSNGTEV